MKLLTTIRAKVPPFVHRYMQYLVAGGLLIVCCAVMFFNIYGNAVSINRFNFDIEHSYTVMSKNQQLALHIERMVASLRGYVMTGNSPLSEDYKQAQAESSDLLADLSELMQTDASQSIRIKELQHYFLILSERLDNEATARETGSRPARMMRRKPDEKTVASATAGSVASIDSARDNISRISNDILLNEKETLDARQKALAEGRTSARLRTFACSFLTAVIFMLLNVFYTRQRMKRDRSEAGLGEAESVFRLAIEGANDGFFEWNFTNDTAFYSRQFCAMLGYDMGQLPPTQAAMRDILHPEDRTRVLSHIDRYLGGEISEYLSVYRLRHRSGRWVWVTARGRALYDREGKPIRLVGAHTDITHIKAYEEKLEKAKEFAEKANRAKTEFLAHMSHEIRTPLTAISGIAEIFDATKDALTDKQRQLVKALGSSTASLKDLVNDILDFSKIESGELELEDKPFRLQDLFDQVVAIFELKAQEKGIRFSFDYGGLDRQVFHGDRTRLRQILINLVGNAIKFTAKGGVAVIAGKTADANGDETLRIEVQDTGIGIDPAQYAMIFERFKQADSSVSRKYGGTGLGLPISLRLARLMGGDINVESAVGHGSTFTLGVPIRARVAETPGAPLPEERAPVPTPQEIHAKRVLLVEDYEGNIVILSYLLDSIQCGYDVARTGLEALNKWKETPYDLLLMDVQMPEMDGFTATAQIRRMEAEKKLPRTPIIGMTAHALVGDKEKCIESGMDSYLAKPIIEADLKSKIFEFLNMKKKVA
ncbi:MAG: ATP-binding protein [Micavibrio sp.]|nr:ATP-binding protein [Micavibrio sp.]